MKKKYVFTSERLGFRNWEEDDLEGMSAINADAKVMEFFPGTYTRKQTQEFIELMQHQFRQSGFCYFAVDTLENGNFIGFIGLTQQSHESDFTSCIDIGWRLSQHEWNKGYATEGAKKCVDYAFTVLDIDTICAIAPKINLKSTRVMKKVGLHKVKDYTHRLPAFHKELEACTLYEVSRA